MSLKANDLSLPPGVTEMLLQQHQTHLTCTVHTDAAVAAVLAGSAVSCIHHELSLAVCRGAVEVTGVAGDMNVVI